MPFAGAFWTVDLGQDYPLSDVDRIQINNYNVSTEFKRLACFRVRVPAVSCDAGMDSSAADQQVYLWLDHMLRKPANAARGHQAG